jgi:hypothetical protein
VPAASISFFPDLETVGPIDAWHESKDAVENLKMFAGWLFMELLSLLNSENNLIK